MLFKDALAVGRMHGMASVFQWYVIRLIFAASGLTSFCTRPNFNHMLSFCLKFVPYNCESCQKTDKTQKGRQRDNVNTTLTRGDSLMSKLHGLPIFTCPKNTNRAKALTLIFSLEEGQRGK